MRQNRATDCGSRSNALWGRGSRGEHRSNALWGRGGRRAGAVVTMAVSACFLAAIATAGSLSSGNGNGGGNHAGLNAYVEDSLLSAVQQNPKQTFDVILQGNPKEKTSGLLNKILSDTSGSADEQMARSDVRQQFNAINGLEASLKGKQILKLAKRGLVTSVMANETVHKSA